MLDSVSCVPIRLISLFKKCRLPISLTWNSARSRGERCRGCGWLRLLRSTLPILHLNSRSRRRPIHHPFDSSHARRGRAGVSRAGRGKIRNSFLLLSLLPYTTSSSSPSVGARVGLRAPRPSASVRPPPEYSESSKMALVPAPSTDSRVGGFPTDDCNTHTRRELHFKPHHHYQVFLLITMEICEEFDNFTRAM